MTFALVYGCMRRSAHDVAPPSSAPRDAEHVVHEVRINPPSIVLRMGAATRLTASVNADAGATVRSVSWMSSNPSVATVDVFGTVTAVSVGTASIVATSIADSRVKGAAVVTVTDR
jgi:uncharacterized protein YjdB